MTTKLTSMIMITTLLFENFMLLIYYFPWATAPTYFNGIQIQKITAIPVGQISPHMGRRFETVL